MTRIPSPTSPACWRVGSLTYTTADLGALFLWLLGGDFVWSLKERSVGPVFQLLLKDFGASDTLSGLLIGSIPAAMALVICPIIAYRSDRFRSRWGRRIPFLAITIPLVALAMPGLAFSPRLGQLLYQAFTPHFISSNSMVLVSLALFWGLFELSSILGNTLFGALINDVVPQHLLGRFFAAFRAVSLIAGMIFNYYFFGTAEASYVPIYLGFGALAILALALLCLKVKEGSYPPPPVDATGLLGVLRATKGYFQESFGHAYYWLLFISGTMGTLVYVPVGLFSVVFAKTIIGTDLYGKLLTLTFAISLVLTYPIGILADRWHPLRVGMAALALYGAVTLWGGLYARTPLMFEIAFVLNGIVSGALMTATASMGQRLLPRAKFAQYASAGGIIGSVFNIAIGPVVGFILDQTHHVYRYVFLMGATLSLIALILNVFAYRAFLAHGGDDHYFAPGDEPMPPPHVT